MTMPGWIALAVFLPMLAEAWRSRRHEARLRAMGAIEPPGDVIGMMTLAYPAAFILMLAESMLRDAPAPWPLAGVAIFAGAKLLKWWAMAALGHRWSFRVLVVPGEPLVTRGPYRWLRHPNYVGVMGELVGVMVWTGAWVSGALALAAFGWLLARRIQVEERALTPWR